MPLLDCSLLETLRIGRGTRIQPTGRVDDMLYVYIDASVRHELGGADGFRASAPSGIGRMAHVPALRDGEGFSIGPTAVIVEAVRLLIPGATALRDIRLQVVPPRVLAIVREPPRRPRARGHRPTGWGRTPCWS